MLNKARQHHAYQRGVHIANLWKHLKGTILTWNAICVAKAHSHKLPSWVGNMPMIIALLGSATAILFGGIVIVSCMLFIWAIAFILQHIGQENTQVNDSEDFGSSTNNEFLTEYRVGDQGYGLYCGSYRMDLDDE